MEVMELDLADSKVYLNSVKIGVIDRLMYFA